MVFQLMNTCGAWNAQIHPLCFLLFSWSWTALHAFPACTELFQGRCMSMYVIDPPPWVAYILGLVMRTALIPDLLLLAAEGRAGRRVAVDHIMCTWGWCGCPIEVIVYPEVLLSTASFHICASGAQHITAANTAQHWNAEACLEVSRGGIHRCCNAGGKMRDGRSWRRWLRKIS